MPDIKAEDPPARIAKSAIERRPSSFRYVEHGWMVQRVFSSAIKNAELLVGIQLEWGWTQAFRTVWSCVCAHPRSHFSYQPRTEMRDNRRIAAHRFAAARAAYDCVGPKPVGGEQSDPGPPGVLPRAIAVATTA